MTSPTATMEPPDCPENTGSEFQTITSDLGGPVEFHRAFVDRLPLGQPSAAPHREFDVMADDCTVATEPDYPEAESALTIAQFVSRVYRAAQRDEHKAVDEVYNFMDDHLLSGRLPVCDETIKATDPFKLAPSLIISFLIVTRRAKSLLPSRAAFYSRAVASLSRTRGRDAANRLLSKYE